MKRHTWQRIQTQRAGGEKARKQVDRATEFIQLYNRLAQHLSGMVHADRFTPFSQLVELAARTNTAVARFASRLRDYGDLRNVIVHYRSFPEEVIAEPSLEALADFRSVFETIVSPERLAPTFQRQVTVYIPEDPLLKALKDMKTNDFSQVVLMDQGHLAVLTTEGIARWLEQKATDDIISIQEATIEDAHTCDVKGSFLVMARHMTISDAHDAFTCVLERDEPRLFAVIITQNGRDTEKPLGIVTPWDLLGRSASTIKGEDHIHGRSI